MQIAIVLYDRFTALDAIGPYEVLSRLPGAEAVFVAAQAGPVQTDNGMLTQFGIDDADLLADPRALDLILLAQSGAQRRLGT